MMESGAGDNKDRRASFEAPSILVNKVRTSFDDGVSYQGKPSFFIGDADNQPLKIVDRDDEEISPDEIAVAPDGGYGWVIVFAAFMSNVIVDGIIFSFGILMPSIRKSAGESVQVSTIALVGSLLSGFYLIAGPFVSALSNKLGFRPVAILGSIIAAGGFALSWLLCKDTVNVPALFALFGVIGGIGFGCIYVPAVIAVGFYFEKKRALATGIAICGSGIGTFVFAPLTNFLVESMGWQQSLLVLAGIILLCGACGALYRPLVAPKVQTSDRRVSQAFGSPDGTPLLQRMKKAREMNKWDSVNSFVSTDGGPGGIPGRKSSTQSLNAGQILHKQQKRMSVPTMLDNQQISPPSAKTTPSTKAKSFIALPDLSEIAEETEQTVDEVAITAPNLNDKDQVNNATVTDASVAMTNEVNRSSILQIPNSATTVTLMIGNSTLTVDEMSRSRILRVNTSKTSLNKPMYRDDIFYSGSLLRIPEYAHNVDKVMSSVEWTAAQTRVPDEVDGSGTAEKCCSMAVIKKMLDFSLLLSPTFLLLSIAGGITMLGFFVPFIYLAALGIESGLEQSQASFLIAIIGIANTGGRIVCGWLADRPNINALMINNGALSLGGLATIVIPLFPSHVSLIIYSCVFGLSIACFASLRSILLVELLGLQKLTNAFGLLLLFQGIAAMVGSPLAGYLYDTTGSYNVSFYVAGALMLVSGVICFPLNWLNKWEKARNERNEKDKKLQC